MKPLLLSSGEPAGIGPDLCLMLAPYALPIVILADLALLEARAKILNLDLSFACYDPDAKTQFKPGTLMVWSRPCPAAVEAGKLNVKNAPYVLDLLNTAASLCAAGYFSALVTAPIHKAVINEAGFPFTGHTEFFAEYFKADSVVMMLASTQMKVALATTHLPLRQVPDAITAALLKQVLGTLQRALCEDFALVDPLIYVAGLNPHAGESGYLGREELDVIEPTLMALRAAGMNLQGPLSADTLFTPERIKAADAFLALYHDQGLPVIKHAAFHEAVNVTLGLPIVRVSVDHGTALPLAGTGAADPSSLLAAIHMAEQIAQNRAAR